MQRYTKHRTPSSHFEFIGCAGFCHRSRSRPHAHPLAESEIVIERLRPGDVAAMESVHVGNTLILTTHGQLYTCSLAATHSPQCMLVCAPRHRGCQHEIAALTKCSTVSFFAHNPDPPAVALYV